MARLGRLAAVVTLTFGALVSASPSALADHCPPIDNPEPIPGQNTTYCHTPRPSNTPEPPEEPEPEPTIAPRTAAPTRAPAPPAEPQRTRAPIVASTSAPATTPFDIEVPEENALEEPEIIVGPLEGETNFEVAEPTASVSNWIFGFIFGFIIGGLVGRASWGLRRKRRQQIFG